MKTPAHLEACIRLSCATLDDLPPDHEGTICVYDDLTLLFTGLCGDRAEGASLIAAKARELDRLATAYRRLLQNAPQSPPAPEREERQTPGTISREDAEHNAALLDAVELGEPPEGGTPNVTLSERAAWAVADFENYREACGSEGRVALPFAEFQAIHDRAKAKALDATGIRFELLTAEEAHRSEA